MENAKENKSPSKAKKAIKICISAIIVAAIIALTFVYIAPTLYLSFKYHENPFSCRIERIFPSKTYRVPDYGSGTWEEYDTKLSDYSWNYSINGKDVVVEFNREKLCYYDFRQIEEIEQLATAYLQDNIDSRIVGIEINKDQIINFGNRRITESNIENFLNSLRHTGNFEYDYTVKMWGLAYPIIYSEDFGDADTVYNEIVYSLNEYKKSHPDFWDECMINSTADAASFSFSKYTDGENYSNVIIYDYGYGLPYSKQEELLTKGELYVRHWTFTNNSD